MKDAIRKFAISCLSRKLMLALLIISVGVVLAFKAMLTETVAMFLIGAFTAYASGNVGEYFATSRGRGSE